MKMKIALATMLSIATASTFAAPKFYGEIDASLDYLPEINANSANHDVWKVNSNSSYLGIKGEEKLTEHLSAVYLAEWAFITCCVLMGSALVFGVFPFYSM